MKTLGGTYHADQVLVTHLLDGNIVDETGDDCSWPRLFTEINLLQKVRFHLDE